LSNEECIDLVRMESSLLSKKLMGEMVEKYEKGEKLLVSLKFGQSEKCQ